MNKKLYFQQTGLSQIDAENGEILGVSLISTPEAKGHNLKIDNQSIQSFFSAVEGKQIKAFMTHHDNESPSDVIGIWENFRIEEDGEFTKLLADFSAMDSWRRNHPSEFDAFFELAEKAPETFGVSAEFIGVGVTYNDEGEEQEWSGEEGEDVFARATEVHAFSIVCEPASNPTGLFSSNGKEETEKSDDLEEIDLEIEDFLEDLTQNLEVKEEENIQLSLKLNTLEEMCELLNKERQTQDELIKNLSEDLEKTTEESEVWKRKFETLKDSGSDPIEGHLNSVDELTLKEKLIFSTSWKEKQNLFQENMSELNKNWKTLCQ